MSVNLSFSDLLLTHPRRFILCRKEKKAGKSKRRTKRAHHGRMFDFLQSHLPGTVSPHAKRNPHLQKYRNLNKFLEGSLWFHRNRRRYSNNSSSINSILSSECYYQEQKWVLLASMSLHEFFFFLILTEFSAPEVATDQYVSFPFIFHSDENPKWRFWGNGEVQGVVPWYEKSGFPLR